MLLTHSSPSLQEAKFSRRKRVERAKLFIPREIKLLLRLHFHLITWRHSKITVGCTNSFPNFTLQGSLQKPCLLHATSWTRSMNAKDEIKYFVAVWYKMKRVHLSSSYLFTIVPTWIKGLGTRTMLKSMGTRTGGT